MVVRPSRCPWSGGFVGCHCTPNIHYNSGKLTACQPTANKKCTKPELAELHDIVGYRNHGFNGSAKHVL